MKEALELVDRISEYLEADYHLRDINGQAIFDLDEAVRAILEGRLVVLPAQCLDYFPGNGGSCVQQTESAPAALFAEAAV